MEMRKNMWLSTRSVQKEVVFAPYCYRGWKVDLFWKFQAQKNMGTSRRTIHIDRKTESIRQKDDDQCMVGPEGRNLLWAVKN